MSLKVIPDVWMSGITSPVKKSSGLFLLFNLYICTLMKCTQIITRHRYGDRVFSVTVHPSLSDSSHIDF